ncbi:hypothetical protein HDV04_005331 [Boothiomyces sp. JEL0838]|nr:hypothetical protein HDV04_005331 [Boothiomyces sp. JEL0838]
MLFGPSSFWDGDSVVFDVSGIHDIMTMYFAKNSFDPFVVTKGINQTDFWDLWKVTQAFVETPVLLRFFAKRDTLAMLYHNIKTGYTLFPALRPGPDIQLQQITSEFWSMYSEASVYLNLPGVTEFSIVRDSFQFYAKAEGVHKIFLLLAQESVSTNVSSIASEVLRNIKNQIAL